MAKGEIKVDCFTQRSGNVVKWNNIPVNHTRPDIAAHLSHNRRLAYRWDLEIICIDFMGGQRWKRRGFGNTSVSLSSDKMVTVGVAIDESTNALLLLGSIKVALPLFPLFSHCIPLSWNHFQSSGPSIEGADDSRNALTLLIGGPRPADSDDSGDRH